MPESKPRRHRHCERRSCNGSRQKRPECKALGNVSRTDAARHFGPDGSTEPKEDGRSDHEEERHDRSGQRRRDCDATQPSQVASRHGLTERRTHL
jgi:hypothetical protein